MTLWNFTCKKCTIHKHTSKVKVCNISQEQFFNVISVNLALKFKKLLHGDNCSPSLILYEIGDLMNKFKQSLEIIQACKFWKYWTR